MQDYQVKLKKELIMNKNYVTINGKESLVEFDTSLPLDEQIKNKSEDLQVNNLAKYYLNENLNFLCGSGTSVGIGGKTINSGENPFNEIISEIEDEENKEGYHNQLIQFLKSEKRLEEKFDDINREYLYYLNNKSELDVASKIKSYLDKVLKKFVVDYVPFPSDYTTSTNLAMHEMFISKIISRKETLSRPRVFTPNYDLAFENACERMSVSYNNGFRGVHLRKFDPDTFHNETYIRQTNSSKGKQLSNYLNIYKLHGSISWQRDESFNGMYNLKEIQISPDESTKDKFSYDSLMIYPLQSKKSYTLDLPYSELFRNFSKCLTESQSTLVIVGYSFLDEHINDIIKTGLYNPNLSVVIHSFDLINDESPDILKALKERAKNDTRIIIYEGSIVGDFNNIAKYLIPLNTYTRSNDAIIATLKQLLK